MSKELTEQWKNGEIKEGFYYLSIVPSKKCIDYYYGEDFVRYNEWAIEEVLAPVPTYDHFVELTEKANQFSQMVKKVEKLEKQLDIATKALKKIDPKNIPFKDFHHRGAVLWDIARKALKEMEEV